MKPLFSIGVTTYNRIDLLRECLQSILKQDYTDLEVIVGNDYPAVPISQELLGITDSRVRIINYPENIGPIKNANELLSASRGRYFTWLADDDMHFPGFLQTVKDVLDKYDHPTCVFTSYAYGELFPGSIGEIDGSGKQYSGAEFLRLYLSRRINTIGCYAMFDASYLRSIGGMEHLSTGYFSPYSDNLLAIRAGMLESVIFVDDPLVFFRTHIESVSYASPDYAVYQSAQREFLAKSMEIFKSQSLINDFQENLVLLIDWCVRDYYSVILRSGWFGFGKWLRYLFAIRKYIGVLDVRRRSYILKLVSQLPSTGLRLIIYRIWAVQPRWIKAPVRKMIKPLLLQKGKAWPWRKKRYLL